MVAVNGLSQEAEITAQNTSIAIKRAARRESDPASISANFVFVSRKPQKKNKPTNFHRKYEQFSSSDIRRENCESFVTVSMQARYSLRVAVLSRRAVLSVLRLTIVDLSSNMSSEKLLLKVRGSFKSEESTLGEKVSKAFDQNWTDTLAASNIGLYVVMRNLSC